jgi:hypothetical protein
MAADKQFRVRNGILMQNGTANIRGPVYATGYFKSASGLENDVAAELITDLSGFTTNNLAEGTTNKYYTDARADARVALGIANLVDSAPATLDTLNELAAALGDDPNFATTVTTALGTKLNSSDFTTTANTWLGTKSTTDVSEGTNQYFTNARARGAVSASGDLSYNSTTGAFSYSTPSTDGITEGTTNKYFSNTLARGAVSASGDLSYNSTTGVFSYTLPTISYNDLSNKPTLFSGAYADLTGKPTIPSTTSDITEGSNLYYTDARARAAISAGSGISYNSTTGVITSTSSGPANTDALTEGTTNLYYTDARSRAALSGGTGVTYNSSTGAISIGQAVATSSDVTFNSVSTATLKASDGTVAATLATSTGDVTMASRLLSSASKSIRNGSNRATSYASVSGATAEDILMSGIGGSGAPSNGLLITNADLPTGSTSGRRPTILIRGYGGQEYNGVASTTAPQPYYGVESSRGTASEPRALNTAMPLGSFIGSSNAGSDLTSGNTPYWTSQNYPAYPSFGMRSFQNHRGPYSSTAGSSFFIGSISGTTLTVTSVTTGPISLGQEIKLLSGAAWSTTTNVYQIIAQTSGSTGSTGTYTLNAAPGTYGANTTFYGCNTTLGSGFFMNLIPNDTPITTTSRVTSNLTPELIQFRAQATNSTTNAYEFRSWATTNYGGTNTTFRQGTDVVYLGLSASRAAFATPVAFPTYTKAQAAAITGSAGWQICISDSASGSNPNGMMAFWDTTNSRWSYIHDNSAV